MAQPQAFRLKVSVERGGPPVAYEVQCTLGSHLLIGNGSHCDVRLLPEDAAVEQLRLTVSDTGVEACALSPQPPCLLAGRPIFSERLPEGAVLTVGLAQLHIELVHGAGKRASAGSSSTSGMRVALMAAIAIAAFVALRKHEVVDPLAQNVEAPALFGAASSCPLANADVTPFAASRLLRTAQLKAERSPFYVRDGVEAVAHFEQAAACFDALGRARERDSSQRAAALLRTALNNDFHARRVRLERFLARQKYEEAQHEVSVLQAFVGSDASDYAQWLLAVQRELTVRFAAAQEAKG